MDTWEVMGYMDSFKVVGYMDRLEVVEFMDTCLIRQDKLSILKSTLVDITFYLLLV